jgi:hypothetical protein
MVAEELVQDVRSEMKEGTSKVKTVKVATKKASKKAPKPKAAAKGKKAPSAAKKGAVSKAGFVRSQPTTMPAKDVVAAGAKLGLSLSPDYIHKVRSTAKAKAKAPGKKAAPKKAPAGKVAAKKVAAKKAAPKKAAPKKAAPRKPAAKRAPKPRSPRITIKAAGAGEAGFRKLVVDLGVVRAKSLLAEVERKLGALIAGR